MACDAERTTQIEKQFTCIRRQRNGLELKHKQEEDKKENHLGILSMIDKDSVGEI